LCPHDGAFDAGFSARTAREVTSAECLRPSSRFGTGELKGYGASFLEISGEDGKYPGNIISSGIKVSEDGEGVVIRLRETSGSETGLGLAFPAACPASACVTDLMERPLEPLEVIDGRVGITIPALGIVSVKVDIA